MGQYNEPVEVVDAEIISDGSDHSQKDYWRDQLKEELRALSSSISKGRLNNSR